MKKLNTRKWTATAAASAFMLTYAANAANIGFVVGSSGMDGTRPFDIGWTNRLIQQGHSVTVFLHNQGSLPEVTNMDLFIISEAVSGSTAWNNFGNVPKPLITYEAAIYGNIFGCTGNGIDGSINPVTITILDPSDPLAAGLSGNVTIYSGPAGVTVPRFTLGTGSSGTMEIAVRAGVPNNVVLALLPANTPGGGGQSWPALRMSVPVYGNWDPNSVTPDGWKLLDNAVNYALIPEPSAVALLGLGMASFLARRQRR